MAKQRLAMMSAGAVISTALAVVAFLLLPAKDQRVATKPRCVRSKVIAVDYYCGQKVIHVNPDGSRVVIGKTGQLNNYHPMPVREAAKP